MASDTKDRICEAALRLFNERGYDAVSLRDVAAEADIAIGTLTYHFAKKEDLLAKMLVDLHSGFEGMLDRKSRGTARLVALLDLSAAARVNQERYPFYFRNIDAIARDSESMRVESIAFERMLSGYYAESLESLEADGVVELNGAPPSSLACAMVALHACWASPTCPAANGAARPMGIDEAMASLLAPLVVPTRAAEYRRLCEERGIALAVEG